MSGNLCNISPPEPISPPSRSSTSTPASTCLSRLDRTLSFAWALDVSRNLTLGTFWGTKSSGCSIMFQILFGIINILKSHSATGRQRMPTKISNWDGNRSSSNIPWLGLSAYPNNTTIKRQKKKKEQTR